MPSNPKKKILAGAFVCLVVIVWLSVGFVTYDYEYIGDGTDSPLGQEVLASANKIAQFITDKSWLDLHAASAAEFRAESSRDEFISQWQQLSRSVFGIQEVRIVEMYVVNLREAHLIASAYKMPMVPSKVLPPAVSLSSPFLGRQAFVLCKSMTDNGEVSTWLTLILKQEDADWRLLQFFISPAMIAGHDGHWFWQKSKEFERAGKIRNALFYNDIASQLLTPSTAIDSISAGEVRNEFKDRTRINMPYPGQRPAENWQINNNLTVSVHYVGFVSTGVLLWLDVRYQTMLDDIESEKAKSERQQIHEYVVRTFPEYKDAFGGIYIGSVQEGGRGSRDGFPFDEIGPSLTPNWDDQPQN